MVTSVLATVLMASMTMFGGVLTRIGTVPGMPVVACLSRSMLHISSPSD